MAESFSARRVAPWLEAAFIVSLLYFLLVGGSPLARSVEALSAINLVLATALSATWLFFLSRQRPDGYDLLAMAALVLFAGACAASRFPRQSFDAATGAIAYVALFGLARYVLADRETMRATVRALGSAALAVAIGYSLVWLAIYADWIRVTQFRVWPPLGLLVLTGPFANRYDVLFLVLMLAPFVWLSAEGRWRWVALTICGLGASTVAILGGSRGALLAVAIATAVAWQSRQGAGRPSLRAVSLAVGALAMGIIVASGIGLLDAIEARLFYLSSVLLRFDIWGASVGAWLQRPLTGMGPGTFPFDLQFTDYFSHATIAVRHPDNPVFQAATEGGILGLAALGLIAAMAFGLCLRRSAPMPARWALAFFIAACLTANPTDFPFLVVPAIVWGAIAAPRRRGRTAVPSRFVLAATVGLGSAVFLVAANLAVARNFHAAAKAAWERGDPSAAQDALGIAITLDPGMALYRREAGIIEMYLGDARAAARSLRAATQIMPSDTTAWRARALAALRTGDVEDARRSATQAVTLRPSESENLVIRAYVELLTGHRSIADASIREALRVAPELTASSGWAVFEPLGERSLLLRQALHDWQKESPRLDPRVEKPAWLAFLASDPNAVELASAGLPSDAGLATRELAVVARCQLDQANQELAALAPRLADSVDYWEVRAVAEGLSGAISPTTAILGRRVVVGFVPSIRQSIVGPTTVDIDGYRIDPLPGIDLVDLPTSRAGRSALLFSPRRVMTSLDGPQSCSSSINGRMP